MFVFVGTTDCRWLVALAIFEAAEAPPTHKVSLFATYGGFLREI